METADLAALLRGFRFRYADEDQLQEGLADAIRSVGAEVEREVRLDDGRSRLDHLVEGRIAIEVKIGGPAKRLEAQIRRYLRDDRVEGIVVVSVNPRLADLPAEIEGKPVEVVNIAAQGL